jgi:cytochrome c551/c552
MRYISILALYTLIISANSGEEVFRSYCWGCHHQTATAFGPSFREIATKRTKEEIRAMVSNPEEVSKILGYRRNAMPRLNLSDNNLTAITNYILSFKPKGKN